MTSDSSSEEDDSSDDSSEEEEKYEIICVDCNVCGCHHSEYDPCGTNID